MEDFGEPGGGEPEGAGRFLGIAAVRGYDVENVRDELRKLFVRRLYVPVAAGEPQERRILGGFPHGESERHAQGGTPQYSPLYRLCQLQNQSKKSKCHHRSSPVRPYHFKRKCF